MTLIVKGARLIGRLQWTDLTLQPGEKTALVGPNGSGKTSLMRTLAGVAGEYRSWSLGGRMLDSNAPAARARMLGYLPASRQLDWPIPVRDFLRLSPAPVDEDVVTSLVDQLELTPFLDRPSNALSTGERARLLIARTLATRPQLLLLDEPMANLDPYWVLRIADLLDAEAWRGATVLTALHDLTLIERFDRLLLMDGCKVVADGPAAAMPREQIFGDTFRLKPAPGGRWQI
ncbi:ABC transporter ATP-binding protein [Sphingomicrobium marinum]|uniref:ABC transporter ATP-binding protein n=1 Tax=Sphingomicrobium marinum TaxID=1227950 RepID=UPI00224052EC|nr:ABC transporter ATP-binding protein [Sphingomicrobium marinum]